MRRALFCLLLLMMPATAQSWETYTYAKDTFEVSAPGPFEIEDEGTERYYILSRSDNSGVMIVVSARASSDAREPAEVLQQACANGAAGIGAEVLSQQPLELDGTPGLACSLTTNLFNMSVRFYLTEDKLYQLISTTSKSEPPWAQEQQLFDSFQLTAPPQN